MLDIKHSPLPLNAHILGIYRDTFGIFKNYFTVMKSHEKYAGQLSICVQELQKIFINQYVYFVYCLTREVVKRPLNANQLIEENIELIQSHSLIDNFLNELGTTKQWLAIWEFI